MSKCVYSWDSMGKAETAWEKLSSLMEAPLRYLAEPFNLRFKLL